MGAHKEQALKDSPTNENEKNIILKVVKTNNSTTANAHTFVKMNFFMIRNMHVEMEPLKSGDTNQDITKDSNDAP